MKIGFTGTSHHVTDKQKETLRKFLRTVKERWTIESFHHGDCVEADAIAHDIFADIYPGSKIVIHPPINDGKRAFKEATEYREPKTYFARNRDIVDETDLLIGMPMQDTDPGYGGTWYTIGYALKKQKPILYIIPDGLIVFK